jgi:hypothetical protein
MNANQRKQISKLSAALGAIDFTDYNAALAVVEQVLGDIESLRDEEQDKYDNMPESLQGSDRVDAMQEGITYLDDAASALESAQGELQTAIDDAEEATRKGDPDEDTDDVGPAGEDDVSTAIEALDSIG